MDEYEARALIREMTRENLSVSVDIRGEYVSVKLYWDNQLVAQGEDRISL
jgi:hypothetical protein